MRSIVRTAAVAGLSVTLVATAGTLASAATPAHRHTMTLRVSSKHRVQAPAKTQPGLAHLRDASARPVIVLAHKHAGVGTLVADLKHGDSQKGSARLLRQFPLVTEVAGRHDGYVRLRKGTYYLLSVKQHYSGADVTTLVVSGKHLDAKAPRAAAVSVDAARHLHVSRDVRRGTRYLKASNASNTMQIVLMVKVARSTTTAQLSAVVKHPTEKGVDGLGLDYRHLSFAEIAAHQLTYQPQYFSAGRYLAVAFGANGHLHDGGVRVLTVT